VGDDVEGTREEIERLTVEKLGGSPSPNTIAPRNVGPQPPHQKAFRTKVLRSSREERRQIAAPDRVRDRRRWGIPIVEAGTAEAFEVVIV
jgi:hypothetical protein